MDPTTLVFYAAVCAVLSFFAPQLGRRWVRFGVGAAVGVVAASVLPYLQAALAAAPYSP